jgi:hypothetical protein
LFKRIRKSRAPGSPDGLRYVQLTLRLLAC